MKLKKATSVKSKDFNKNVLIHGHCHQKSQNRIKGLTDLLNELNIKNSMIDSSCCGMAIWLQSFGYSSKTIHEDFNKKMDTKYYLSLVQ